MNTSQAMNTSQEIETLWQGLLATPFPGGFRAKNLKLDLAGADGYCAGCVSVFLESGVLAAFWRYSGGVLDEWRVWVLRNCLGSCLSEQFRGVPLTTVCSPNFDIWRPARAMSHRPPRNQVERLLP